MIVVVTLLVLFVGSVSVGEVTTAVFVTVPLIPAGTSYVTSNVLTSPTAIGKFPNVHGNPPPHSGLALTKLNPAGVGSLTVTNPAASGPLFVITS
jgi:hypothetical protein